MNRPKELIDTVQAFYRQINSYSVKIYISDNSDDESSKKLVEENFGSNTKLIEYMKNESVTKNYQTNFMNLFSHANGKYLWFFGDDDLPYDYALEMIFSHINDSPDFIEARYIGFDQELKHILPYWNVNIKPDDKIKSNSFTDELISTFPYNGFISFMIMKKTHLVKALHSKLVDFNSNYIQTNLWAVALLTMPLESFGYSLGKPIVKWREDFGTATNKRRWQKSRFLLSLEHREIFAKISIEFKTPALLKEYDGKLQHKLLAMALDWKLRHHMSLDDSLQALKQSSHLNVHTRIFFILISIFPVFILISMRETLSSLYKRLSFN